MTVSMRRAKAERITKEGEVWDTSGSAASVARMR